MKKQLCEKEKKNNLIPKQKHTSCPAFARVFITELPIIQCDLQVVGKTPRILYPLHKCKKFNDRNKTFKINFTICIAEN